MGREPQGLTQSIGLAGSARPASVIAASAVADLIAVAAFVIVGRLSHDEPFSASGLLRTGWPFAVGVLGGYIGIVLTRWPVLSLRGGAVIAVKTSVIGVVLRYGVARDGAPFSFVVVTILVLTILILGWRWVVQARTQAEPPDRS